MRALSIHDTRTGRIAPLEPRDGRVGIYACGPTVYNRIHVGNARPFVVFSLLRRFLEHEGLEPTLVINVTDVNDKIYAAARRRGIDSATLVTVCVWPLKTWASWPFFRPQSLTVVPPHDARRSPSGLHATPKK